MRFRLGALAGLIVLAIALVAAPAASGKERTALQMYTLKGSPAAIADATEGVELAGVRYTRRGLKANAVLTRAQRSKLDASGVRVRLTRNRKGRTVARQAALMAVGGFNVWRSWDEDGGIRDELFNLARRNPQLIKLEVLGRTHEGRELIALKLTQGAREVPDGARPAVLYSSLQHAREWISVEVNRRTLRHFIDRWRANDKPIKDLLKQTELWFVIVANPDGYQYTFDTERLWRKNLRDNNDDGQITVGDGVDPNRNFNEHWGYDNEGSSPDEADETYRGPGPASEPETQFLAGLIDRIKPKFQSNMHSFGEWLLYPQGWQIGTLDADNPLYVALGGTDANSAIEGFNPGQSADTLYVTNGETTDYAETTGGTIAYTPELGEGQPGAGFVFPDNEALIQAEFERLLAVPPRPGAVRGAPREPVVAGRHRRRALLPGSGRHRSAERAAVAVRLQVRRLLRRPAGGARARQAQPRGRHAELPGQRRRRSRPTGPDERVGRRRPLRARQRHLLPRGQRPGDRDRHRRQREGLVHRRRARRATRSPTRSSPTATAGC